MDLQPGTKIGPYRIRSKISDGGMSTLYTAELRPKYRRRGSPRRVVLKVANWDREAFLKEEAEFLARFQHSGIVRIYPLPTPGGDDFVAFARTADGRQPYFALEYAGGGSLEEYLVSHGPLPVPEAVSIAAQVARALDHAHSHGVVNRDVKPGNILFRRRPSLLQPGRARVVLCDFGIAQDVSRPRAGESRVGTIAYMSPEQIHRLSQDWVPIGPPSDVFALGVVLYEMLTGRTPFDDDIARIVDATARPQPPSSLRSGIPPLLDKIVLHALEKDPRNRFQSAAAVAQALARVPRRINWHFVVGRSLVLSLLVLAMLFAWQLGSTIRDGRLEGSAPLATWTAGPLPTVTVVATAAAATAFPSPPPATSMPPATAAPTVTLRHPPTSTPIRVTATRAATPAP